MISSGEVNGGNVGDVLTGFGSFVGMAPSPFGETGSALLALGGGIASETHKAQKEKEK